jgi:hypothetical protein
MSFNLGRLQRDSPYCKATKSDELKAKVGVGVSVQLQNKINTILMIPAPFYFSAFPQNDTLVFE